MNNANINNGAGMKIIKLVAFAIIILSSVFPGCVQPPAGTPTPTVTPTVIKTLQPTAVPTTYIPTPTSAPVLELPVKYRVWIDSDYGFYRIRAIQENYTLQLPPDLDILNITIRVGDSVRWINDDSYDFPLTVVSNEGLWTGRTGLMRYQGERFEYTFNKTGIYTFSIREYPRIQQQKITVKPR